MRYRYVTILALAFANVGISSNAFAAFGRTSGVGNVSRVGSAQYSIPLWTPPGIGSIQPHLALSYDSNAPYGLMGKGWTLSGLSVISRCIKTFAQDGAPAPVTLTTADALCIDGKRLRNTGTGTYQTELADFSSITSSGTAGNGPASFVVRDGNGLTYEYGNTSDSRILPSGSSTAYIWAVNKISDAFGNTMTFAYSQSNGSYVPLSIRYAAPNGSSTFPYQIDFAYSTKAANDTNSISIYIAGSQIQKTSQLSTIIIKNSGSTVRSYKLTYTTSTVTLRAGLTSIQECGGTECLLPTAVIYQDGSLGVSSASTSTGSSTIANYPYNVDINGDGLEDLVFMTVNGSNYQWWVQIANSSGYAPPISTGIVVPTSTKILLDDFLGNGQHEILAPFNGEWYVYSLNNSTFSSVSIHLPYDSAASVATADTDGDGLPDFVWGTNVSGVENIYIRKNVSSSSTVAFSGSVVTALTQNSAYPWYLFGNNSQRQSPIRHYDFDGDGLSDIMGITTHMFRSPSPPFTPLPIRSVFHLLSRGTTFLVGTEKTIGAPNAAIPLAVQWNDDACTDLMFFDEVQVSGCNGSSVSTQKLAATAGLVADWDGDGRMDALYASGGTWMFQRSLGTTPSSPASTGIPVGSGNWGVADRNGDGLDDLIFADSSANYAMSFRQHNGAGINPDLAISFTDGLGNAFSPSYVPLPQASYSRGTNAAFPQQDFAGPLNVVTSSTESDGIGGSFTRSYSYSTGIVDRQGRGFQGFYSVREADGRDGTIDFRYYSQQFPYAGLLSMEERIQPDGQKRIASVTNSFASITLDGAANNQRYFPYVSSSTAKQFEIQPSGTKDGALISTKTTSYATPDNYGNFGTVTSTLTDNDSDSPTYNAQWVSTTARSFSPDSSNSCLHLPTQTAVTKSSSAAGGASITRTASFTPDYGKCRYLQKIIEPGSASYRVTENFGFDSFGHVQTNTVTGVGMASRTTTTNWSSDGLFPQTVINPLSQTVTFGFDSKTGQIASRSDPNSTASNPLSETWTYDNFGRLSTHTALDGTSSAWSYDDCSTNGCVGTSKMTVTRTDRNVGGSTRSTHKNYLDSFDRPVVQSDLMLDGSFNRQEIQYDNHGNPRLVSTPCTFSGCVTYWTTNTFDLVNRLTLSQRPLSATDSTLQKTQISYAGRTTTVTDALNHATTKITLPNGALARSQSANGYYQKFVYDVFGSLLNVSDSLSNTLFTATYDYGIDAFQTNATDMDLDKSAAAGQHRQYIFDALGELTNWSDARGSSFTVTYDPLSRPLVRTEKLGGTADLTTTWTWGSSAADNNIGALASISATGPGGTYSEIYTYDSKTRLAGQRIAIPSDATYDYTLAYNATTGLLDTLQYPNSTGSAPLKLQYTYANGLLQKISDFNTSSAYWLANSANARGQVTQETLGNGIVTTRSIDPVFGALSALQSGSGGGAAVQNESYLFDGVGNVVQRQNNNAGLTENFYYDNLNRLDHSTLNSVTNLAVGYDVTGNITSRSDIAGGTAWTYDAAKKHAVRQTGTGGYAYTYDANGNAITRNGSSINWTSYNMPSSIDASGKNVSFLYGPTHQRFRQTYTSASPTETTFYIGDLLEKVVIGGTTDFRHYIRVGGNLIAIASRTSAGVSQIRYVLEDHEGSIAKITDGTGAVAVSESFTAFGMRRDPNTWSGAPSCTDLCAIKAITRRGFTGEEAVGGVSMGLNHLNGRVQDAVTGRFLSPDPYLTNPNNTQSFNRYAYVNNNPLTFVDPSGFNFTIPEITVTGTRPDAPQYGSPESPAPFVAIHIINASIRRNSHGLSRGAQFNPEGLQQGLNESFGVDADDLSAIDVDVSTDEDGLPEEITVTGTRKSASSGFDFSGIGRDPFFAGLQRPFRWVGIYFQAVVNLMLPTGFEGAVASKGVTAAEQALVDANKLNHIFGNPSHNLETLVAQLGSREAVFGGVQSATQAAIESGSLSGVFETTVTVGGQSVVVRGNVVDGIARIGTFFVQ